MHKLTFFIILAWLILLSPSVSNAQLANYSLTLSSSGKVFYNTGVFPDSLQLWYLPGGIDNPLTQNNTIGNPPPSVAFSRSGSQGSNGYKMGGIVSDLIFQADVMFTNAPTAEGMYIHFRVADTINFYSAKYGPYYGGILLLNKNAGGVSTPLQYLYGAPSSSNTWYNLEIRAAGSSLKLYFNHTLQLSATDSIITSGFSALALGICCSSSNTWYVDNIKVFKSFQIMVTNLQPGQKVELCDSAGTLKTSNTVVAGKTNLALDVSSLSFPFTGYFKVYSPSATLLLTSDTYTNIWGGDVYDFQPQPFVTYPPHIFSVKDVPHDQGGKVTLQWQPSSLDTNVITLPFYSIWRTIPQGMQALGKAVTLKDNAIDFHGDAYRYAEISGVTYAWEWIANQPAHRFAQYSYTAPTLYDSMSTTGGKHYFLVSAQTSDPNVFYNSNVDSGYSVDNIPPLTPKNLMVSHAAGMNTLHWNANSEIDLRNYVLYRGISPNSLTVLASPSDTHYVDLNLPGENPLYYAIRAQDIHENLSLKSNLVVVTGIMRENEIPKEFSLAQNYPNPFNPSTTIRFALPKSSHVALKVYSLLGEVVITLVNEERPAGTYEVSWDANGTSSGIYFYRLTTDNFVENKKLLLVK
jgi:hypothetical protein